MWRLDKPKEDGYSHELISAHFDSIKDQTTMDELLVLPAPGVNTLQKAFDMNLAKMPDAQLLGTKGETKYDWLTWKEVDGLARDFAAGCMALDLVPEVEGEGRNWRFLGIQSKNRKEWGLSYLGNIRNNGTAVALYDTLGIEASKYVINQTGLSTIACQGDLVKKISEMKIGDLADGENGKLGSLKNLITFDALAEDDEQMKKAEEAGLTVYTFDQVLAKGKENTTWTITEPGPDDCPMFSYTSGTTGDPKGVKLTHQMLVGTAAAVKISTEFNNPGGGISPSDTYISYLPSAHSFEAALFATSICFGQRCGYFGGDILKLVKEDLPMLQPTFFPSVPRLFNKIFGQIQANFAAAGGVKGWLIKKAVAAKQANLKASGTCTHGFYDKVVFKKVKALVGGNVRIMLTGSAPISAEVLDFLKICFCCYIYEGYGMTETSAGSVLTKYLDPKTGHVGGPVANVKIRLRDIPEMNYLHTSDPPKGEVCFWGPSIMKGYFKNPEKTAEAMDGEWLKSGDVAMIHPNGAIQIVDRAKNIFKLSQGEYIAPEKLENQYIKSEFVAQIWIHGDSLHDWTMAFVVVEPERVKKWAAEAEAGEFNDELMKNAKLKEAVMKDLLRIAGENKFNSLEKPKQLHLLKDMWTIESDMLTPTMKTKRSTAKNRYKDEIEALYKEGPLKF